jgi:hypothetical protein
VQNALLLLSTVALDESNLANLRARNAVDMVVQAMYAHYEDESVRAAAAECFTLMASKDDVTRIIQQISDALPSLSKGSPDATVTDALANNLASLAVLAATPATEQAVKESKAIKICKQVLREVGTALNVDKQEEIISACTRILFTLSSDSDKCAEIVESGIVKVVISSIKVNPQYTEATELGLSLLQKLLSDESTSTTSTSESLLNAGAVELCVVAMRTHTENQKIVDMSLNVLKQLSKSEAGAIKVAKKGGTRQIFAVLKANEGHAEDFARTAAKCFQVGIRVCLLSHFHSLIFPFSFLISRFSETPEMTMNRCRCCNAWGGTRRGLQF